VCNEGTDACEQVASPDGTACTDDLFCTLDEHCRSGACVEDSLRDCSDGDDCTDDACNEELDQCDHTLHPRPEIVDVCGDGIDNDCDGVVDACCGCDGTFAAKVDYLAGDHPNGVTSGDFNADGILDLAVANYDSDSLSILLGHGSGGRGDGTFAAKADYTTGDGPYGITAGDFNSDGILDLAVVNFNSNNVSILLGDGTANGTFTTKVDYLTGDLPNSVTSGDFNSDGILDLAVVNYTSSNLSILLGNGSGGQGDGTFTAKVDYPTGENPNGVTSGDFNADGILDLATVNYTSSNLSILMGNGNDGQANGTFTAKVDYTTGDGPYSITAGDFNADGIIDLAVGVFDSNNVSILLGNGNGGRGDGTFSAKVDYLTGDTPSGVTSGDFNADGILDLAVTNWSSNNVSILLGYGSSGQGDGTFSAKVDYPTGNGPRGVAGGDFNADGILDLAVTNGGLGNVSILLGYGSSGQANGTFTAKVDYPTGNGPRGVASGDFNADGILDLAAVNYTSDHVSIFLGYGSGGRGDGTFAAKVNYTAGDAPWSVATGDFDADGILDLAVANWSSNNVSIFLGNGSSGRGNGTFASKVNYPTGNGPRGVAGGDFNADGILDLTVANYDSDDVSILLGNGSEGRGNGTFTEKVDYSTGGHPFSVTTGDFNSDGILDLAAVNYFSNKLHIFMGEGECSVPP
jgi:hypothetical protein